MPSCSTYHLTWISLTLGVGYLIMAAPAKHTLLLTLNKGYLLTATPPDLERGVAPLGPPIILLMNIKMKMLDKISVCRRRLKESYSFKQMDIILEMQG